MKQFAMTDDQIDSFLQYLKNSGKSRNVIAEYTRCLNALYEVSGPRNHILDKEVLHAWREKQVLLGLAAGTVTNRVVKINHFLRYLDADELCFPSGSRQNLAGQQFGSLLAIAPTNKRSSDRSIYWKCRCTACGKEKEIPANQLKKGVQISCGCDRMTRLQKTNGYIDGTCLKNIFSDKMHRNNTSGYRGVFLKRGKWAAQIQYKKKVYYLGSYDHQTDAIKARKQAEIWVREDAEKLLEKLQETS